MTAPERAEWGARCEAFVRQLDGDAAHDLAHVRRVVRWAVALAAAEDADPDVVLPAAWLHDCVVLPKGSPARARASALAAERAEGWLRGEGFPEPLLPAVAHAIEAHSFSARVAPRTVEARVVQDADRLDALGAIGIARCYATAGALGSRLVHPLDPVPGPESARPLDDRRFATDHFAAKLLRLPETMQTAAGQAEAERRAATMRAFLDELARETAA